MEHGPRYRQVAGGAFTHQSSFVAYRCASCRSSFAGRDVELGSRPGATTERDPEHFPDSS
jgi:hypothetical protein